MSKQDEFDPVEYNWSLNRYVANQAIKAYSKAVLSRDIEHMRKAEITEGKTTAGGLKTPSNSQRPQKTGGSERQSSIDFDGKWLESIGFERSVTPGGSLYWCKGLFTFYKQLEFCAVPLPHIQTRQQLLDAMHVLLPDHQHSGGDENPWTVNRPISVHEDWYRNPQQIDRETEQ